MRLDKWLWGARLYKTRTAATDACRAGHVKLNRMAAKPATLVKPGDHVEARTGDRLRVLEVTALIEKRAGAAIAAACYCGPQSPSAHQGGGRRRPTSPATGVRGGRPSGSAVSSTGRATSRGRPRLNV